MKFSNFYQLKMDQSPDLKPKTLKIFVEETKNTLQDIGLADNF